MIHAVFPEGDESMQFHIEIVKFCFTINNMREKNDKANSRSFEMGFACRGVMTLVLTLWVMQFFQCRTPHTNVGINFDDLPVVPMINDPAGRLNLLDAEDATISGLTYTDSAIAYTVEYQGQYDPIRIVDSPVYEGTHAIEFRVNMSTDGSNDRSEIRVSETVDFNIMRWIGFAFYAENEPAGIVFQCHQFSPNRPPVSLHYKSGLLKLEIHNDDHRFESISQVLGSGSLRTWYIFQVGFKGGPSGDGVVEVYVNGTRLAGYSGKIGYTFEDAVFDTVKVGLYRGPQAAINITYVDDVQYGTTRKSVNP